MKAHRALVEFLAAEGVDTVFTLASEEIIGVLSDMIEGVAEPFRVVHCRHEQSAALMADGYARVSGEIGVCIVGRGPAIAQTGTALVTANRRASNVLYIVPEPRSTSMHDGKGFEQESFLRDLAGSVHSARSLETLLPTLAKAFREIRSGQGPIAVQVPIDVIEGSFTDVDIDEWVHRGPTDQQPRLRPDDASIEDAVDAYLDADATKAPIVLVGRGAIQPGALEEVTRVAKRMGAYIVTTVQAIGALEDHPYHLGFVGDLGSPLANEYLQETGFVLALGSSLTNHTVDRGHLLREDAKVVHVDTEADHIERFTTVDVGVVGDAKLAAATIADHLEELNIDRHEEFWSDRVREEIEDHRTASNRDVPEVAGTVDPRDLMPALDDVLPKDRVVVSDVGHFCGFVFDGFPIRATDRHVWAADFIALGQGIPMGLGAAFAREDRTCVIFAGDAGTMMSLPALETLFRENIPAIVVVMNDNALGAEYHVAKLRGHSESVGDIPAPHFAGLAEEFGGTGYTIRSLDDLDEFDSELTGPVVLDCKINTKVTHRTMGNLEIE